MFSPEKRMLRMNKTCDQCSLRKVRCIVPQTTSEKPTTCIHCANRNEICKFSPFRRKYRVKQSLPALLSAQSSQPDDKDLLIDRILRCEPQAVVLCDELFIVKAHDERITTSGLSFFSNQRVSTLTEKIGTNSLRELVEYVENLVMRRICGQHDSSWIGIDFQEPITREEVTTEEARACIEAYFENVHPVYPFLDQEEFNSHAFGSHLPEMLQFSKPFSALYHAILASGSQYHQGGSFEPNLGRAWNLFQISLSHMSDILVPPYSLVNLQALTAMSIFAMNASCMQLDQSLAFEAANMAQSLRYHKFSNAEASHLKTFWTVYYMEKYACFNDSNSSLLADDDIGCVVPSAPESKFGEYDWFLSAIRLGRLSSITYSSLFSTSASLKSKESYIAAIKNVRRMLEDWRLSVPVEFRPKEALQLDQFVRPSTKLVAIQTQYLYYNLIIALERLTLHVDPDESVSREDSKWNLLSAARAVVELIQFIEIEPYMPIFVACIMPISALFVIFDFVIHNPTHSSTERNLALLDQVAAYLTLLDIASRGNLPGSVMSQFAGIARQYVDKVRNRNNTTTMPDAIAAAPEIYSSVKPHNEGLPLTACPPEINFSDFPVPPPTTSSASYLGHQIHNNPLPIVETPLSFESLFYPASDSVQMSDASQMKDLKTLFDWTFPDWTVGDTEG